LLGAAAMNARTATPTPTSKILFIATPNCADLRYRDKMVGLVKSRLAAGIFVVRCIDATPTTPATATGCNGSK
jgi:hypothetical protein